MHELLSDNNALHEQVEAIQGVANAVSLHLLLRTCQREVTSNLVGVLLHHIESGADFRTDGKGNVGLLLVDN